MKASWLRRVGRLPLVGPLLRRMAGRFAEGSVVTIRAGHARGLRWRRHHRYVNGYWLGHYEQPIQDAFAREIESGGVVFDAGANAGFLSLVAARCVGPTGQVVAIDPDPDNQASIAEQIELNDLDYVHPAGVAIGAEVGTARFVRADPGSPQARVVGEQAAGEGTTFDVAVLTLDDLAARFGRPTFVKLDIEGAELDALDGAPEVVTVHRPRWLIETHGSACAQGVIERMRAADYELFDLSGAPLDGVPAGIGHVIARPRS